MTENSLAKVRRANLQRWMDEHGAGRSDLAGRLQVSKSYVTLLFSPDRHFGEKAARSIERKLRMPTGYLDEEVHGLGVVPIWGHPDELPDGAYGLVPRVHLTLNAEGELQYEEQPLPPLPLRQDWLLQQRATTRANLCLIDVPDDSMEDWLRQGDQALVDLGQAELQDGKVYAIRYGSELRVRRLARRFDGGLVIRSDNRRYAEEVLSPAELQHIGIIGRVLWRAG